MSMTLDEARAFFSGDLYATQATGITIEEVGDHFAKCRLNLDERHRNAAGGVMGGVAYTLADFVFAVATNAGNEQMTVTTTGQISYLAPAKGKYLTGEATMLKEGKHHCFYRIDIKDENEQFVAVVMMSGAHIPKK